MNRLLVVCLATVLYCWSCQEPNEEPVAESDSASVKTDSAVKAPSPFFPVYDYLSNEIDYVDSTPVGIMKYRTIGKLKDSGYIQLEEFHALAGEFHRPEINDSLFAKKFRETSFVDKSNGNATFFYKPVDTSTQIKRVDVVTVKGDVYDEVKSLYIELSTQIGDTPVTRKLFWKPKRNFQIITVKPSGENDLIKVVWDNRE